MRRLKVTSIFGGRSEEHPVSVKSAQEVERHLDLAKYEPFYLGITTGGAWKLCDGPHTDWDDRSPRPALLSPDSSAPGLLVLERVRWETIRLDVVFPVLHGKLGEDGAMQGLDARTVGAVRHSYVGCGIQSSALCAEFEMRFDPRGAPTIGPCSGARYSAGVCHAREDQ